LTQITYVAAIANILAPLFIRDFLSASKARELSVLSDIDSGGDDGAEDALRLSLSERSSSMPTPSSITQVTTNKTQPNQSINVWE
jgi:hypothetical protein